ncbi:MAG: hypothetical protein D4R67_00355 [Bacteroidetes bacterium]|nr:MAG: hypothetical protein D4R67_00355 [Bacteroidota bacterium]
MTNYTILWISLIICALPAHSQTYPYFANDSTVYFIYTGNAGKVALAGDATSWKPTIPFSNVAGTPLWYLTRIYEPQARLDYKIVVDDTTWILDPLNTDTCMSGFGPNSELRMPGYQTPPEVAFYPDIPHGILLDINSTSTILGNSRTVTIYLPAGYGSSDGDYPVVLFHDGLEFLKLANAKNILDYLIAHRMITPLIGIFVPPVLRDQEYTGPTKDSFRQFLVEELMPVIDEQFRTRKDPGDRAMVGISNGGNIALYIGITNPELFGKVAAMSSNYEEDLFTAFQKKKTDLELYLDMGTYDIPLLEELASEFTEVLEKKGYTFIFHTFPEGHSWGNWEGHLRLPLMQFFPVREAE